MRRKFGLAVVGRYGDKRGVVKAVHKSKQREKKIAEIQQSLDWLLTWAEKKHIYVLPVITYVRKKRKKK